MTEKTIYRTPRSVVLITAAVFFVCAYKLYDVALTTGNYRGMWFSLLHLAVVGVGACVALRRPVG